MIFSCLFPGIGYSLDPDFSFVKIAAPYAQVRYLCDIAIIKVSARKNLFRVTFEVRFLNYTNHLQELLDLKEQRPSGTQLVAEMRKQADDVT